ncbi:hypothetical protein GUITHDRAFT_118013 [Guillardia theta CCMP2712]|uniref:Uncharacterized protein n=1 Tax=Guillardia theta (strain CCMP2712) TaxID=905079 RepID=L1II23_GUITC|nr:hypothetical protein GUITHDRAFT_118013 [Guillardia theta CCMP2712]EKX35866.1 hypothetical protein GUITHDRAFT_118013 [Guillardia theta CCMP2712]|eukprot:XP_005822846.1 hypothetical protein GUITHDRAFT_118013 [Guillardia theta CCMP2712]
MDREIRRRDTDKEENGGERRARKIRAGGEELDEVEARERFQDIRKANELFEFDNSSSATQTSELVGCTTGVSPAQPGYHHKVCYNPVPWQWYNGNNYHYAAPAGDANAVAYA